jgi:alkyl hydroperoxide reductase subunit AhpC
MESMMTFRQTSDRKVISYPKGICDEIVKYKFYIPSDFEPVSPTEFIRKSEVSKTTLNYDDAGE